MKATFDDTVVRYEDFGRGPAILVLHDGPSNRDLSTSFAALAEAGYRVVITHLDGFGKKRTTQGDLSAYSRQASTLLSFLGIGRAIVFGIGIGGIVLLDLLDSRPERVAASSLVFGPATVRRIKKMAGHPEIIDALQDGRYRDLKDILLKALPAAQKDRTALSDLPQLQAWINGMKNRNLYLSAIQHRGALLADMNIPPLLLETEGAAGGRKTSIARRGLKKIKGVNAQLSALIHVLSFPEQDIDDEEILSLH